MRHRGVSTDFRDWFPAIMGVDLVETAQSNGDGTETVALEILAPLLARGNGMVRIRVAATRRSPRGTVFASFSFAEVPVNVLTGSMSTDQGRSARRAWSRRCAFNRRWAWTQPVLARAHA